MWNGEFRLKLTNAKSQFRPRAMPQAGMFCPFGAKLGAWVFGSLGVFLPWAPNGLDHFVVQLLPGGEQLGRSLRLLRVQVLLLADINA